MASTDKPAAAATYTIDGRVFDARPVEPGLYPVATPIGNLGDMTLRALEVLASADLVVCEDTRVTRTLFDRYGLTKPLAAYHEHNAARERPRLLAMLRGGMTVALVSDAGTPLVSDPGYKLVEEALAEGVKVIPIPGPSAILAALVAAGLPTDAFLFLGFLPPKTAGRRARLAAFAEVPATLVLYEAPHGPQRRSPTWPRSSAPTARRRSPANSPRNSRRCAAAASATSPPAPSPIRRAARSCSSPARPPNASPPLTTSTPSSSRH